MYEPIAVKTPLGELFAQHEFDEHNNPIGIRILLKQNDKTGAAPISRAYYDDASDSIYVTTHATGTETPTDACRIDTDIISSNGVNLSALKNNIHAEAKTAGRTLSITEETETDILTYDNEQNREINYHLKTPDAKWLQSLIFITPDVSSKWESLTGGIDTITKRILELDHNMLINLRKIIITTESEKDMDAIAEHMGCEICDVCNYLDYVGMFWYAESAVVINVEAIEDGTRNLKQELHLDDKEYAEELAIGFYSTLFHEIRHLGMENPFLPEDNYPDSMKSEASVETWCRIKTDAIIQDIKSDISKKF